MKRTLIVVSAAFMTIVAVGPSAHAKGAKELTITGPQLASITIHGEGRTGRFAQLSGFWYQAFQSYPDPTTGKTSATELGPRYTVSYLMAAPTVRNTTVLQYIYPYAQPQPQSHLAAGQAALGGKTKGGWYTPGQNLVAYLQARGLPSAAELGIDLGDTGAPPEASAKGSPRSVTGSAVPPSGGGSWWPWTLGGVGLLLGAAYATTRVRRVRATRAPAT